MTSSTTTSKNKLGFDSDIYWQAMNDLAKKYTPKKPRPKKTTQRLSDSTPSASTELIASGERRNAALPTELRSSL